jgi:AhpD family alkylhydroperoxidase
VQRRNLIRSIREWMYAKDTCPREWKSTFMKFTVHTAATAPAEAGEHLRATEKAIGFVPNLLGVLAEAPIALRAYIDLTELLGKSSLSPVQQQIMMLAASYENNCGYCMAAHSTLAGRIGIPANVLAALRNGSPIHDSKLEALRSFVAEIVQSRGRISDRRIDEFLTAGYTRANVLEAVFAVSMKTLSNYTNHITETPVDTEFTEQIWSGALASSSNL